MPLSSSLARPGAAPFPANSSLCAQMGRGAGAAKRAGRGRSSIRQTVRCPEGATWQTPAVSVEGAWDVAAFIDSQPRPQKAQLDRDFPNRLQKPVDTPYGPYADGFDEARHKFGPFQPIREAIKALTASQSQPTGQHGD